MLADGQCTKRCKTLPKILNGSRRLTNGTDDDGQTVCDAIPRNVVTFGYKAKAHTNSGSANNYSRKTGGS